MSILIIIVPPVDEIKQAIIDYGPVTVAIYVGSEFQAYGSDIFNTNQNGTVNHGVVLVGWDDNQGSNGIWILRNSVGDRLGRRGVHADRVWNVPGRVLSQLHRLFNGYYC